MKIIDYRIVLGVSTLVLADEVRTLISNGWVPLGSVAVDSGRWAQAMVRFSDGS